MHDGIHVENAGIPSATICTDRFVPTAQGMARMWGAPDYPTIFTPHPIENMDRPALKARAEELAPMVVRVLTGEG
ncbi:MAG: hypothetical protein VX895_02850 [Chloroflexota bacterium]|nr:hypothetical protein [Dehalococcoidia bacterium]MEC9013159.1 hypothetical protein [Chloroflexota bacterium]MED5208047.1 hypothetical protein [Chloroflexota bacterium]MEE3012860.1 hypothetical protein [Chloroflexota bacterium]GIS93415.1 MAG: hypothetical protein CM1200mP22_06520 [Dehalococcoidia bacterium]